MLCEVYKIILKVVDCVDGHCHFLCPILLCVCLSVLTVPHAPVNAKATVIGQSPGKTVVKVTWEHAEGGVKADWYDLDFISDPREAHVNVPGVSEYFKLVELMV